jgi:hypothetical protein
MMNKLNHFNLIFCIPDCVPEGGRIATGAIAGLFTWTRAMADFFMLINVLCY